MTKAGTQGLDDNPDKRLRVILTNQQALFSFVVILGIGLLHLGSGDTRLLLIAWKWVLVALLVLPVNYVRLFTIARVLSVLSSSGLIVEVTYHLGLSTDIQLFLYTTVLLPAIMFTHRERLGFWLSVTAVLVCQFLIHFGYVANPESIIQLEPGALQRIQFISVIGSILGVVLIFRFNNTLLMGLLRRSLRHEQQRAETLEQQQIVMRQQADELIRTNAALVERDASLRADQTQLEAQAKTLQQNEATLTETIRILQTNQKALEATQLVETGMAKLADILRWDNRLSQAEWCDRAIREVALYAGCVQGLLYVREMHDNQQAYVLRGRFAANPEAAEVITETALAGVQQASVRRMAVSHLKGLGQQGHARGIVLGGGELQAHDLLVLPLVDDGQVLGFMELVSCTPLTEGQATFAVRVSGAVAASLVSVRAQEQVKALYEESQRITATLQKREEQMHQQLSRMVESQQAMRQADRDLKKSQDDLKHLNENLEQMVSARTAELEQAMHELQSTQTQLVQSEKMATLGQLIAGIAHEINTPIGAIKASSENLTDLLTPFLHNLPGLLETLPPAEKALFLALATELTKDKEHLGSSEERKLRRAMQKTLEGYEVPEADEAARRLVESGFHGDPEPYLLLLRNQQYTLILDTLYRIGQLRLNIENVGMAVDKTKKIVYALKNYAHSHSEETFIPVNLQENLDTIITLFTNKIKYTIQLELDYHPIPNIQASPDELGQVWTNLVHNALQAMNYEGRLIVRLFEEDGKAVVQVIDSGAGIPTHVLPRIFDAFYTTKKRGEGTGLGLHLSKKIIERHSGIISAESEPGRTVFTVRLPFDAEPKQLEAPEPAAELVA